jgi:4-oxalocrotonate tautomerase
MVSVEGEHLRSVTWVIIEDVKSGEWGVGGKCMTTDDLTS